MNRIFDALIDQIDEQEKILFAVRGRWQAYVEINGFAGVSSLILPQKKPYSQPQNHVEWRGRSLKDLAARIRSEEPDEAALGCAALNAWYNRKDYSGRNRAEIFSPEDEGGDVFRTIAHECRGKIVSTIGHFHGGEKLEGMRELRVFEKEPKPGDLPAHMEERLLPSSDIVIITGMALTNHTMPEILRYSQGCKIILTGPSVPLSEVWFEYGVSGLFGTFVWNVRQCHDAVFNGGHKEVWASMGKMVIRHKEI